MVVFASSRASWLLSLAVLGLACTGIREDPSPGGAPPPGNVVVSGSGGAAPLGGGAPIGGGAAGGGGSSGSGVVFDDCSCAAIIESNLTPACNSCVDPTIMSQGLCESQLNDCTGNTECALARTLLANNDCGGNPDCTSALLTGILSDASAALFFGYYNCVCTPCASCSLSGAGGGAPVGGGGPVDGTCDVSLK